MSVAYLDCRGLFVPHTRTRRRDIYIPTYLSQGVGALPGGEEEPLEVNKKLLPVVGGDQPVVHIHNTKGARRVVL